LHLEHRPSALLVLVLLLRGDVVVVVDIVGIVFAIECA
jgi:type III secretory pathway component EscS